MEFSKNLAFEETEIGKVHLKIRTLIKVCGSIWPWLYPGYCGEIGMARGGDRGSDIGEVHLKIRTLVMVSHCKSFETLWSFHRGG